MKRIVRNTAARVLAACTTFLFASAAGAATDVTWTGTPLTASSTSIRTDGTLKYAYAYGNYTANGVTFIGFGPGDSIISTENCVVWEATGGSHAVGTSAPSDTESGDYKNLLQNCWWATAKGRKVQLNNLESGKQYLLQIVAFRQDFTTQSATSPDSVATIKFGGTDWEYGGSLTCTFTASGTSEEFTIGYSGQACINGIQVRELDGSSGGGGGDEPTVVDPSIGSASVSVSGSTATVSLGGIVLGTDAQGTAATSYDVSYSLTNAASVTALSNQSGATASFAIANLADGSYACAVTVTTDKGKTATKSVSFAISTSGGGGGSVEEGWTVGPMAADGSTIRTDGTLLYAYSSPGGTMGGVPFARAVSLGAASMVSASPASAGNSGGSFGDGGATGDFGNMLRDGWYWTGEEVPLSFTLTLSGLTAGHSYLVQLVSHRTSNSTTVSANGSTPVYVHGTHDGVDYTYGASLVGVFTATGATADITVTYPTGTGNRPLNAIQVREIAAGSNSTPLVIAVE